jgi:murein DD-endopeptidase MepM/ murein hydrolase activator NlpD
MKSTLFTAVFIIFAAFLLTTFSPGVTETPDNHFQIKEMLMEEVENNFIAAVDDSKEYNLGFLVYDTQIENVNVTGDGRYAAAWLVPEDPETGKPIPAEPGLALAEQRNGEWVTYLPNDEGWIDLLRNLPDEIMSEGEREQWLAMAEVSAVETPAAALSGYLLPWPAGQSVSLSRSVSHDRDIPSGSAHYSFDFYISGRMWDIYASKGGTVWSFKDTVPNNTRTDVNYLVVEDTTTNPHTYHLYLHLAQDSIPKQLKQVGAPVLQGQFIGVADNTGISTGHHLHFQVQVKPVGSPYWARSVDITFDDVFINGGRPRRIDKYVDERPWCIPGDVCEAGQLSYVSDNVVRRDLTPPAGNLVSPLTGELVAAPDIFLAGWAADEGSGLYNAQFIANYGVGWKEVGPLFNQSPMVYEWNLCSAGVPDGPVSVGMRLKDNEGNVNELAGIQHFIKQYECPPPPTCLPRSDEVALFRETDFVDCHLFSSASNMGLLVFSELGENQAASIWVGSSVQANLFKDAEFKGRAETIIGKDANLSDNLIGKNSLSSMQIWPITQLPAAPLVTSSSSQGEYSYGDMISLAWENRGGSLEYVVQVSLKGGGTRTISKVEAPYLDLEGLAPGEYTWKVRGVNQAGSGAWSTERTFKVASPATGSNSSAITAPYIEDMESIAPGWSSTGLWHLSSDSSLAYSGSKSWWFHEASGSYGENIRSNGHLTSPPVRIPNGGFFLRFQSRYETETSSLHWDRRWIQISQDDGPFENILQLFNDPPGYWMQSPYIDLSRYAGSEIRVRFYFDTMDGYYNQGLGWGIDDFSISREGPPECLISSENNSPETAVPIKYGDRLISILCPPGDVDYYRFQGQAGDRILVDVDAVELGSELDSVLYLLDRDRKSILAVNDDEIPGEIFDPKLGYRLNRDGDYYLRLQAWDHPAAGSSDHFYELLLLKDMQRPQASFAYPLSGTYLPNTSFTITAQAVDSLSGVQRVEFFWHPGDWLESSWKILGKGEETPLGWMIQFDPAGLPEGDEYAFYLKAHDRAGNWSAAGVWNLGIDRTPPVTALKPIEPVQSSTAIRLEWTGTDKGSGVAHYDLQFQIDGGPWQDHTLGIDPRLSGMWVVGESGRSYAFRLRGVDRVGNFEPYPSSAEAVTYIPSASVLCADFDDWEPDNSQSGANLIVPNISEQQRNFCNPLSTDRLNDQDWVKFAAEGETQYFIQANPSAPESAARLSLYTDKGELIASVEAPTLGRSVVLKWFSEEESELYVKIEHIDGRIAGSGVTYRLRILDRYELYLPLINTSSE